MEAKLKVLKVVDLKQILSTANISAPGKSTKSDLIAKILSSKQALDAYAKLHPPDDLLAPPEEVDWNAEQPELATEAASTLVPPQKPVVPKSPAKLATPAPVATTTAIVDGKLSSEDPELEKRKRRAERFGIPLVQPKQNVGKRGETAEQLEVRGKGNTNPKPDKPAPSNGKKRPASKAEEVDPEELERRKKRAARFGVPVKS